MTPLRLNITDSQTEIPLEDTSDFPTNGGVVLIETETISYTYASDTSLLGCSRGYSGSTAVAHSAGTSVALQTVSTPKVAITELRDSGAPTDDLTGVGFAVTGSRYTDQDNGSVYVNTGTTSNPAWTMLQIGSELGITELTGEVTAGPGNGSQVATLSDTTVTPGAYTAADITVDSKGRITAAANGSIVTPAGSNTEIQFNNSGAFGASSQLTYVPSAGRLELHGPGPASNIETRLDLMCDSATGAGANIYFKFDAPDTSGLFFNTLADVQKAYMSYNNTDINWVCLTGNIQFAPDGLGATFFMSSDSFASTVPLRADKWFMGSGTDAYIRLDTESTGERILLKSDSDGVEIFGDVTNGEFVIGNDIAQGARLLLDEVAGTHRIFLRAEQVNIGAEAPTTLTVGGYGGSTPSAVVEIISSTQGFLPPRLTTTAKNAISTPAAGLVVYDTTLNKLCVYTTAWETITSI